MTSSRPRYTDRSFPPYSYVPGYALHPVSDPSGHMYGEKLETPSPLEPESWQTCNEYLFGIDLFNHGYYWEAHEAWESLWHVAGRQGPVANFLKGLIKLAAAGVKAREGNPRGVQRHARRALELLGGVHQQLDSRDVYCGLNLAQVNGVIMSLLKDAVQQFAV
ncbi:MAG: DUF309 domain-containing protein, partial [Pirellulales bacterium]|nr:DUF309 domain-containing protein [Pirellulales bacterium]